MRFTHHAVLCVCVCVCARFWRACLYSPQEMDSIARLHTHARMSVHVNTRVNHAVTEGCVFVSVHESGTIHACVDLCACLCVYVCVCAFVCLCVFRSLCAVCICVCHCLRAGVYVCWCEV